MNAPGVVELRRSDPEQPGYLSVGGEQVYYIHHRAQGTAGPRGAVLLAAPFASERSDSYLSCVRWARQLAAAGFEVFRFDYRGIGESTGVFRTLTLDDRVEDLRSMVGFIRSHVVGVPVILHGMRLGAVLASELFVVGVGDAMLLWAPPLSAQDHLWEVLRFTLAAEMVQEPGAPRRTRDDCVKAIEDGGEVNVGGYFWTAPLWRSGLDRPLRVPTGAEVRPWRIVDVRFKPGKPADASFEPDPHRHQVACPRFWEESQKMTADIGKLTEDGLAWLDAFFPHASDPSGGDP